MVNIVEIMYVKNGVPDLHDCKQQNLPLPLLQQAIAGIFDAVRDGHLPCGTDHGLQGVSIRQHNVREGRTRLAGPSTVSAAVLAFDALHGFESAGQQALWISPIVGDAAGFAALTWAGVAKLSVWLVTRQASVRCHFPPRLRPLKLLP
jgi:hypothetical protein